MNETNNKSTLKKKTWQKRFWVGGLIVIVVALTGVLSFLAGHFTSPAQKLAESAPPDETLPTAKIEERVVSPARVGRATIKHDGEQKIVLPATDEAATVTKEYLKVGDQITSGKIITEVNGHPIIALHAAFSPYRELKVGDSGTDVEVLTAALKELGLIKKTSKKLAENQLVALNKFLANSGYELPVIVEPCEPNESVGESEKKTETDPTTQEPTKRPECSEKKTLYLPANWWIGVPNLPATLVSPAPNVGTKLTGDSALQISGGKLTLTLSGNISIEQLTIGETLEFTPNGEPAQTFTISELIEQAGPVETQSETVTLVRVTEDIPATLVGKTGKITAGQNTAQPTLAVPLTALTSSSTGEISIRVVTSQDLPKDITKDTKEVPVTVTTQYDGWAAISSDDPQLTEGTVVVLG